MGRWKCEGEQTGRGCGEAPARTAQALTLSSCVGEMETQGNPFIKTGSVATASVVLVSCGLGSDLVNESKKVSRACKCEVSDALPWGSWGVVQNKQQWPVSRAHGFQEILCVCWMYSEFKRSTEKLKFKYYSS